jgi:hypothetical protein
VNERGLTVAGLINVVTRALDLRRLHAAALTTCLVLIASTANAQWWSDIQVRKTFDGGRGEQEAATVAYVNPAQNEHYWLIDVAARINELVIPSAVAEIFVAPVVEYHSANGEPLRRQTATNKLTSSINAEMYFDPVANGSLTPILVLSGSATRDYLNNLWTSQYSSLLRIYSTKRYGPDGPISGTEIARYVPFFGLEYFRNLPITAGGSALAPAFSGLTSTFRLFIETFPLNGIAKGDGTRLELIGDIFFRRRVTGLRANGDNFWLVSAGATYYVLRLQNHQVGLSYALEYGQGPKTNFVKERRAAIGLRIRLGS